MRLVLRLSLTLTAIAFLSLSVAAFAQKPSRRADSLERTAGALLRSSSPNFLRAASLYGAAGRQFKKNGDRGPEQLALHRAAVAFRDAGYPDSAVVYWRQAWDAYLGFAQHHAPDRAHDDTLALTQEGIGEVFAGKGRLKPELDSALNYLDYAVAHWAGGYPRGTGAGPSPREEARLLLRIGEIYANKGQADSATHYRDLSLHAIAVDSIQSLAAHVPADADPRVFEYAAQRYTVSYLGATSNEQKAIEALRKAVSLWQIAGNNRGVGRSLSSLAAAYRLADQPDSAVAVQVRADWCIRRGSCDSTLARNDVIDAQIEVSLAIKDSSATAVTRHLGRLQQLAKRLGGKADQAVEGEVLVWVADLLNRLSRPDSALSYYDKAIPLCILAHDTFCESDARSGMADLHAALGNTDSAAQELAAAIALQRSANDLWGMSRTLVRQALFDLQHGRVDSAVHEISDAGRLAHEIGDRVAIATVQFAFARIISRGTDSAGGQWGKEWTRDVDIYREVRSDFRRLDRLAFLDAFEADGEWNARYSPDMTENIYPFILSARKALGDQRGAGRTLARIGDFYVSQGKADSAYHAYAQAIAQQDHLAYRVDRAQTLLGLGSLFGWLARADSALFYFKWAAALADSTRQPYALQAALRGIGLVELARARYDSALAQFRSALRISREINARSEIIENLQGVGRSFYALDHADSALSYYRQSETLFNVRPDKSALAHLLNGNERGAISAWFQDVADAQRALGMTDSAIASYVGALNLTAETRERQLHGLAFGRAAPLLTTLQAGKFRRDAFIFFDSAAYFLATVSVTGRNDADRIGLRERSAAVFSDWALAWLTDPLPSRGARGALAAAERGRAQELLDLLKRSSGRSSSLVNATQIGANLAAEADTILRPLRRNGVAMISYLMSRDTLLRWLLKPSGELILEPVRVRRDSLARLVASLRTALGVRNSGIELRQADLGVDEEPNAMAADTNLTRVLNGLAKTLLPPDLGKLVPPGTEMVIVPHDVLNLIPFTLLPFSQDHALGEIYPLRYAPSLASLSLVESRPGLPLNKARRDSVLLKALVVGNPSMPRVRTIRGDSARLAPLPAAQQEAAEIAGFLHSVALQDSAATESAVRARLPAATLVHLATHGVAFASEARVRDSYVALAPDAQNDGLLTIGELLDDPALRLNADLVVLSACQTGLGELSQTEGTVGFQRALLAQGARSVLVSLWSVNDAATRRLMERFYAHWLTDSGRVTKAEALRRAQLDVRSDNTHKWRDPKYWAAFQLVGAQ